MIMAIYYNLLPATVQAINLHKNILVKVALAAMPIAQSFHIYYLYALA